MEPEWLKVATSPGLWIIAFVFAGNALIQSFSVLPPLPARRAPGCRSMNGRWTKRSKLRSSRRSAPRLAALSAMTVMVLALGGAYAFARESAGVGSIMYELIAARAGAEAAGVPLTREGMTPPALLIIFWVAALGSVGWVLIAGVFTRWLPKIKTLIGGGNATRLRRSVRRHHACRLCPPARQRQHSARPARCVAGPRSSPASSVAVRR